MHGLHRVHTKLTVHTLAVIFSLTDHWSAVSYACLLLSDPVNAEG